VISSILEQFTNAGSRFIKRVKTERLSATATSREPCWEIVSKAEARLKISHALRDKRHDPDLSLLFARIQDTIVAPNRLQALSSDTLYKAINAKILTVKLTGMETDAYIKNLLLTVAALVINMESAKKTSKSLPLGSDMDQYMGSKHTISTLDTKAIARNRKEQSTKSNTDTLDASRWLSSMSPFPTIPYPSRMKNSANTAYDKEKASHSNIELVLSDDLTSHTRIDSADFIDIYCE
jgi:hypothetical protein